MSRRWYLYVLKLEDNKWYVGITSQTPEKRFLQHKEKIMGANWTRKFPPISIYYSKDLGICHKKRAERYENRVTRKYMKRYGYNNVRGGDLSDSEDYVVRFGYIYTKKDWNTIKLGILLMAALMIICALIYYIIYEDLVVSVIGASVLIFFSAYFEVRDRRLNKEEENIDNIAIDRLG